MRSFHLRGSRLWFAAYLGVLTLLLLLPADVQWHAGRAPVWLSVGRDLPTAAILRDALANATLFLPFGILFHQIRRRTSPPSLRELAWTGLLATAFSVTMETAQYMLAWRESSLLDVISDATGAIGGWGIAHLVRWRRRDDTARSDRGETSIRRAA